MSCSAGVLLRLRMMTPPLPPITHSRIHPPALATTHARTHPHPRAHLSAPSTVEKSVLVANLQVSAPGSAVDHSGRAEQAVSVGVRFLRAVWLAATNGEIATQLAQKGHWKGGRWKGDRWKRKDRRWQETQGQRHLGSLTQA
jgi:hypothetical protein